MVTIYSIGLHELPPYLKFLKKHPTVNVSVEYRRATQLYEDIVTGMADIGLVAYPQKIRACRSPHWPRICWCSLPSRPP